MSKDELTRYTTEDFRVYTDNDELWLPSVSTVLDELPTPKGLKIWKERNDGENGNPHWEDILNYKASRGTMIHYELLNQYAPEDIYGENEASSTEQLKTSGEWSRYERELPFAKKAWKEISETRGISKDSVLKVECFVTNTNLGYAGQFDLLYVDSNGNLVLSDLKTSKRVYDKHKMQLVAYERALNLDPDILEVIRIHPDSKSWEVSQSTDWSVSRDEYWRQFANLRIGMGNVEKRMQEAADDGVQDG